MESPSAQVPLSNILQENREKVETALAARLAKQEMGSGLFSFLGYGPQALLLKDVIRHDLLWAWVAVVMAAEMTNAALCFFLQKSADQPARRKRLTGFLMFSLALSGSVWGSVILLPGVTDASLTWTLQQVAIGVVAIASTQALAAHRGCLAAFTLGILAPTILAGLFGHTVPLPFAIMNIGLFIMCQLYGWTTRKLTIDTIVAELTIRKAKEAAETANSAKSVFLSNMSHELRTPLNAILGYTQILTREDNMTEQQQRQLGIMQASGEHLLTLIGDVLDLSKIEAQKMEVNPAPFLLEKLLEQLIDITRPRAIQKGLELRLETDPSLPVWLLGDEIRVRQILLNLLSNAVKFTAVGSVTLRVSYSADQGGTLVCEVEDTGIGIPQDKLETVFEPFTQLAPEAQRREGAGLGLTICRRLATLMSGNVTASSLPEGGSTFRFHATLPPTQVGEISTTPTLQKICGYGGARRHVLVVDDNPINVTLLSDILAPLGFEVRTGFSGEEAIRLALESPPDLLLLDLVMPDQDGVETAKELRRHASLDTMRIIGVSATVTEGPRKQAFADACNAFLSKPVQVETLLQTIGTLLDLEWLTTTLAAPKQPAAKLTPHMLSLLTPELRADLGDAALSLDGDRITALIPHIETVAPELAPTLADLVERFDYPSILNALRETAV
jgi:signal transduction histidine kinase/DNA-binding response OmpR family regulator